VGENVRIVRVLPMMVEEHRVAEKNRVVRRKRIVERKLHCREETAL